MEMPFLEHLEELRRRTIVSLVAVGAGFAVGWVYLAEGILRSLETDLLGGMKLKALTPLAAALARMRISLVVGIVIGLPVIVYELLAFLVPALKPSEKRLVIVMLVPAVALFLIGLAFGYLVMVPFTMDFLQTMFNEDLIENMWSVDNTVSFIFLMLVVFGSIFEYPLIAGLLARLGVLSPGFLRKNRPLAVIGILVVAAVITPDPTMVSQIIVAIPMYVLYEIGIVVASVVYTEG